MQTGHTSGFILAQVEGGVMATYDHNNNIFIKRVDLALNQKSREILAPFWISPSIQFSIVVLSTIDKAEA